MAKQRTSSVHETSSRRDNQGGRAVGPTDSHLHHDDSSSNENRDCSSESGDDRDITLSRSGCQDRQYGIHDARGVSRNGAPDRPEDVRLARQENPVEEAIWDRPAIAGWHQSYLQQNGVHEVLDQSTTSAGLSEPQPSCPPSRLGSGASAITSEGK